VPPAVSILMPTCDRLQFLPLRPHLPRRLLELYRQRRRAT
jgi:hypothetical protein